MGIASVYAKYRPQIVIWIMVLLVVSLVGLMSVNKTTSAIPVALVLAGIVIKFLGGRWRMTMLFLTVVFNTLVNSLLLQYGLIQRHTLASTIMYFAPNIIVFLSLFVGTKKKRLGAIEWFSFAFLVWMVCMIFIGKFFLMSPDPKILVVGLMATPVWIFSYYSIYRTKQGNLQQFVKLIAWMSIIICTFGILDVLTKHSILQGLGLGQTISLANVSLSNVADTSYYQDGIPRMLSVFGSALTVGNWVCSALPIMLEATLRYKNRLFLFATLACLIASAMSLTRASWVSIVLGACVALIFSGRFKGKIKLIFVSVPALLIIGFAMLSSPKVMRFINSSINGTNSSNVYHLMGIQLGLQLMKLHPIIGLGTSNSPYFSLWSPSLASFFGVVQGVDVESSILDLGIQLGIVGVVTFSLFVLAAILGAGFKQDRLRKFTIVWLFTTIVFNANVNYIFYDGITALLMFGFFALSRLEHEEISSLKQDEPTTIGNSSG